MAKQTINVGTTANDRTGDTLRSAFTKVNSNFTELYAGATGATANIGYYKFQGDYMGTVNNPDTGGWGGYNMYFDPMGEGSNWMWIPNETSSNSGSKFEIRGHNGVLIYTNNNTYEFTNDSKFKLPSGGVLEPHGMGWTGLTNGTSETPVSIVYKNAGGDTLSSFDLFGNYNSISTYNLDTDTYYNWVFNNLGGIEFPELIVNLHNGGNQTAQTLQFARNMQAVITGPTPEENASAQRIIIQGQRATGTGEGGDVYLWGGDSTYNGGDIKIYAGDADDGTTGQGGYVNIDGGNGFDNGGNVGISGGNSTTNGGNIFISGGYGGAQGGLVQIGVSGGAHNTIFHPDGGISIPLGPGILKNVQSVSTGGVSPIAITGNVVFADTNAAEDHIILLLPTPTQTGIEITVKNINSGGYTVNVIASTDESVAIEALDGTISTSASGVLYGNCHATWVFDGGTWRITNRFTT